MSKLAEHVIKSTPLWIPDEKAQCPQSSEDLSYIEVEGVQLHPPGKDEILKLKTPLSKK